MEFNYGLIYGFTVGVNYLNFEGSNEGEYTHVIQVMLGILMLEWSWTQ